MLDLPAQRVAQLLSLHASSDSVVLIVDSTVKK